MDIRMSKTEPTAAAEIGKWFQALRKNVQEHGPQTAALLAEVGRSLKDIRTPKP